MKHWDTLTRQQLIQYMIDVYKQKQETERRLSLMGVYVCSGGLMYTLVLGCIQILSGTLLVHPYLLWGKIIGFGFSVVYLLKFNRASDSV